MLVCRAIGLRQRHKEGPVLIAPSVPELRVIRYGRYELEYKRVVKELEHRNKKRRLSDKEQEKLQSIAQSARLIAGTSLAIVSMMTLPESEPGAYRQAIEADLFRHRAHPRRP